MRRPLLLLLVATVVAVSGLPAAATPDEGRWRFVADAPPLDSGAVITMRNGRVLGVTHSGAYVFHPAANRWVQTRPSPYRLHFPMLASLPHGEVLLFGGAHGPDFRRSDKAAVYNPRSERWTEVGSMNVARDAAAVVSLPGGRVLVAGGNGPRMATPLASTEIYDARTQRWTRSGPLSRPRAHPAAVLLPDRTVMVAGGYGSGGMRTVDLFDLTTATWHVGVHLPRPAEQPALLSLPSGSVLAVGLDGARRSMTRGVARYQPRHHTWVRAPHIPGPLWMTPPVTVMHGQPLVVGGAGRECRRSVFTYAGPSGWRQMAPLPARRCNAKVVTLSDDTVLAIGGLDVREGEVPAPYRHTTFRFYR